MFADRLRVAALIIHIKNGIADIVNGQTVALEIWRVKTMYSQKMIDVACEYFSAPFPHRPNLRRKIFDDLAFIAEFFQALCHPHHKAPAIN